MDFGIDMDSRSECLNPTVDDSYSYLDIGANYVYIEHYKGWELYMNYYFVYNVDIMAVFLLLFTFPDISPLVCIVGPNGVGKSTLLLLLTGKLNPVRPHT